MTARLAFGGSEKSLEFTIIDQLELPGYNSANGLIYDNLILNPDVIIYVTAQSATRATDAAAKDVFGAELLQERPSYC